MPESTLFEKQAIKPKIAQKIHFMGIGGSGMAAVAKLARKMGYAVSGCDLEGSSAYSKNIKKGHNVSHLKNIDLLVITPAVLFQSNKDPEYLNAKKRNMVMTWQEFLGKILLRNKRVIAIAGTHGKSTTSAMVGKLLEDSGLDPIVVLGANVSDWGGGVRFGKGQWAVVEADEFNENFLNYEPEIILLNNIEFDHPDYFKNEEHVKKAFGKFVKKLKGKKILITQKDSLKKKFNLKVFGAHNQQNANMVYVLGKKLNISDKKIVKSLESFKGIGRRMELLGKSKKGFRVYDDYAHHPTAVKTTLEGLRKVYPDKKIWCILEAHGFERTYKLLEKYRHIFDSVDGVLVGPIYKARDKKTHGLSSNDIAKVSKHRNIYAVGGYKQIAVLANKMIKKGNVVVVMGAGKSYIWARELLKI